MLSFFTKKWRLLKDISFVLCLVIVFLLIVEYNTITTDEDDLDETVSEEDYNKARII